MRGLHRFLLGLSLLTTLAACATECPDGSYEGADGICHLEEADSETTPPDETTVPDDTSQPTHPTERCM